MASAQATACQITHTRIRAFRTRECIQTLSAQAHRDLQLRVGLPRSLSSERPPATLPRHTTIPQANAACTADILLRVAVTSTCSQLSPANLRQPQPWSLPANPTPSHPVQRPICRHIEAPDQRQRKSVHRCWPGTPAQRGKRAAWTPHHAGSQGREQPPGVGSAAPTQVRQLQTPTSIHS